MQLIPQGDYYVWFCDWCDSRNLTLWTRVEKGKVLCGACLTPFATLPFSGEVAQSSVL
ncbi:MAG TPA: hypothetical protein VF799_02625 [Geobacteraceae bacterium]